MSEHYSFPVYPRFPNAQQLKSAIYSAKPHNYFFCNNCGERFPNASQLKQHQSCQIRPRLRSTLRPSIRKLLVSEKECVDSTNEAKSEDKILIENQIISENDQSADVSTKKDINGIIIRYCSLLRLPKEVQNFARELFNQLATIKEMERFIQMQPIRVVSICVYIGSKACHHIRTWKELCDGFGVDMYSLKQIYKEIHKLKSGGKLVLPVVHKRKGIIMETAAERFAQRYANRLKLNVTTINNLKKTARNIMQKELFTGAPKTVVHKRKGIIMETAAERFAQRYANRLKLNVTTINNLKKTARNIMQKELF
eukprot:1132130_1